MNTKSAKSILTTAGNALDYTRNFGLSNLIKRTYSMMVHNYRYDRYVRSHSVSSEDLAVQAAEKFAVMPVISIIVPTFNTPKEYLIQMIESVTSQSYPNWELCIADGSPFHGKVEAVVSRYQEQYPSIRFKALDENLGIAGNTNAALDLATGDYVALLDHDDFLTPDALYEVVRAINSQDHVDVVYTDEDKYDSVKDKYYDPNFKPDFDLDYLRCCNYITHFYVVRKTIVDEIQGFSTTMDGSQDYDFILRTTEKASGICHIPRVLYHWRIHSNSVAGDPTSKMYAYDAAQRALSSHYQRCGIEASVSKTENLGFYRTQYKLEGTPLVSIVMTHCDPFLKNDILHCTKYPMYEFVSRWSDAKGEYILFLDNVYEVPSDYAWLTELVSNCQRSDVGAVSGKVLYPNDRIFEFGLLYDQKGRIVSPFYNYPAGIPGYYHLTESQHSVSLVDGRFLLTKRTYVDSFIRKNHPQGLREPFAYELCLYLQSLNKRVVVLPHVHMVLRSQPKPSFLFYRFDKVPEYIAKRPQDPMYNSSLSVSQPYII